MGDEADRDFMNSIDQMVHQDMIDMGILPDPDVWTMRDGTEIQYQDMTLAHLLNSKRMLARNDKTDYPEYTKLVEELQRRRFIKRPPHR